MDIVEFHLKRIEITAEHERFVLTVVRDEGELPVD
jgi:hypothetical protein